VGIRRASRAGQSVTIPLLCDPSYQAARRVRALGGDDPRTDAGEASIKRRLDDIDAEEARFAASLDAGALTCVPDDCARATIKGLDGATFKRINDCAALAGISASRDEKARVRITTEVMMVETLRAGLVDSGCDGFPVATPYPVEQLSGEDGIGPIWPQYLQELHERIVTFSTLGESVGSSAAPSCDEPKAT